MKTFLAKWYTNYDINIRIINTENISQAQDIALEDDAWPNQLEVYEIDTTKPGIVLSHSYDY